MDTGAAERCASASLSSAEDWGTTLNDAAAAAQADSDTAPSTLYSVLGVSITASAEAIRSAYRRLARTWHPDRHHGADEAKRRFQQVQRAYEVLSDATRRHEYDLNLLELLDVEEYLSRFQGFILTACGLGMSSREDGSMGGCRSDGGAGLGMGPDSGQTLPSWGSSASLHNSLDSFRSMESQRARSWFLKAS